MAQGRQICDCSVEDCKVVTVISPLHQGSKLSSCNGTFQGITGWKKQCVKQPDCVKYYNEGMFGIDKSNQYLSRYPCYIKSKFHWWKVLFFHSMIFHYDCKCIYCFPGI